MIAGIERLFTSIQMLGKVPMDSFIDILGGTDEYLVSKSDDLVSYIAVSGSTKIVGDKEREEIVKGFDLSFASMLKETGHVFEFSWKTDPMASPLVVDEYISEMEDGANKAGLNIPQIFAGKRKILTERVTYEETAIALWTKSTILSPAEKRADTMVRAKNTGGATIGTAQPPLEGLQKLVIKHKASTASVIEKLRQAGIACRQISTKVGCRHARNYIYPSLTGSQWAPVYAGEDNFERVEERAPDGDWSGLFPPALVEQMLLHGSTDISSYSVRIGDQIFGYVNMISGASADQDFSHLVDLVNRSGSRIPWRVLWRVEGGVKDREWQRVAASVLLPTNTKNKSILGQLDRAAAWEQANLTRVYLSASFATWAPANKPAELDQRLSQLTRAIGNWAGIQVSSDTRDPLEGVFASVPGICANTVAIRAKPRLTSAFRNLPIMRPGGPWERGSVMFHTPDGKPFFYEMGSKKQTAWFDIIVGQQGSGKSALVNSLNLGAALDFAREGAANELPRIGIIDIGYSSRGLIEGIKDGLPAARKHEALYIRWQNKKEHAVNVFDTPLGLRYPLQVHMDFLKEFVNSVLGLEHIKGSDLLKDIAASAVEEAFRVSATLATQHKYEPQLDPLVDAAIESAEISLPDTPLWWEIVDFLSAKGLMHEAMLAQRYAVPRLSSLASAVTEDRVRDVFKNSNIGDERALDVFSRKIDRAMSNFEVLCHETKFDLAGASIVSLDLSEVTAGAGELGKRKVEVMYLAARHLVGGEYYLVEEDFSDVDEVYRDHHVQRIRKLAKQRKRLVYDEFHMTEGSTAVQLQLERDVRIGRKYDVQITLVSQLITDFSDTLLSLARSFFICSSGGDIGLSAIRDCLKISDTAAEVIRTRLRGPTQSEGAPFYGIFDTDEGRFEHHLVNTLAAEELWLCTTKRKDVELKRALERKLGQSSAWKVLCNQFPGGSAQHRLELITADLARRNIDTDPTDYLVDELAGVAHG
ncbi:MAG: hypothetical protein JKY60_03300 [Kordiimonadaceae bacterium]|nr:hypothetical protein [Kordiimonadaceae bacterium]